MIQYKELLEDVLKNGIESDDRTGTGTISVFGRQVRYDISEKFPLVTLKKTFWKGIVVELFWMLRGESNIKFLNNNGVKIWDAWANEDGELGPVYGVQWRRWKSPKLVKMEGFSGISSMMNEEIDQVKNLIDGLKNNPYSRRHIITAWNVADLPKDGLLPHENAKVGLQALPPCHAFFQFYVREGKLSCQLYQRSADLFLGVPFNIASYSLLTYMLANEVGLKPGEFIHTFGDLHLYKNHVDKAIELMSRKPKKLPTLTVKIPPGQMLEFVDKKDLTWKEISDNIVLEDYESWPTLKGEISV